MTTRPILFSGPMVRALLAGRKTQTRRVVKPQPEPCAYRAGAFALNGQVIDGNPAVLAQCPYGAIGDRLWVRETFACIADEPFALTPGVQYAADGTKRFWPKGDEWKWFEGKMVYNPDKPDTMRFRPSIHMPRWASRITLQITDVRVERVNDITNDDAHAEGVFALPDQFRQDVARSLGRTVDARDYFLHLFYDINKRADRTDNPWVWAITFQRIEQ